MKVELAGEEFELKLTFERMRAIEKEIGSLYSYPDKCAAKTVTAADIVCIYYHGQEGTAYNMGTIFTKVMEDGLVTHVTRTYDAVMSLVFGEKLMRQIEDESKKKLEEDLS